MRGWRVYRSVLFFPFILAVPIVGIVASYMFQLNGVVNAILGVDRHRRLPTGSAPTASLLWTVMFVIVWREVGFGIVLFLARLLTLPEEQLEAARIDGAGWWSRLRYVILPELKGTIEFYVVVAAITMLAWVFGYVCTLTEGRSRGRDHRPRALHLQPGAAELVAGYGVRRRGAADGRDDDLRRACCSPPAVAEEELG